MDCIYSRASFSLGVILLFSLDTCEGFSSPAHRQCSSSQRHRRGGCPNSSCLLQEKERDDGGSSSENRKEGTTSSISSKNKLEVWWDGRQWKADEDLDMSNWGKLDACLLSSDFSGKLLKPDHLSSYKVDTTNVKGEDNTIGGSFIYDHDKVVGRLMQLETDLDQEDAMTRVGSVDWLLLDPKKMVQQEAARPRTRPPNVSIQEMQPNRPVAKQRRRLPLPPLPQAQPSWTMIPAEKFVAACRDSTTKLAFVVYDPVDVGGLAHALELGVDALCVCGKEMDLQHNRRLWNAVWKAQTERTEREETVSSSDEQNTLSSVGGIGEKYAGAASQPQRQRTSIYDFSPKQPTDDPTTSKSESNIPTPRPLEETKQQPSEPVEEVQSTKNITQQAGSDTTMEKPNGTTNGLANGLGSHIKKSPNTKNTKNIYTGEDSAPDDGAVSSKANGVSDETAPPNGDAALPNGSTATTNGSSVPTSPNGSANGSVITNGSNGEVTSNGDSPNGIATNGAANGSAANGANGSVANGSATNGANGSATNGTNGSATNGANGANGSATNGANGSATNGANGSATNGDEPTFPNGFTNGNEASKSSKSYLSGLIANGNNLSGDFGSIGSVTNSGIANGNGGIANGGGNTNGTSGGLPPNGGSPNGSASSPMDGNQPSGGGSSPRFKLVNGECWLREEDRSSVILADRICVDFTQQLTKEEGCWVGSSPKCLALLLSEAETSPSIPARPFRVNAGPIHSYILMADGTTKYLSELKAGDQVEVYDAENRSIRSVAVGRLKSEVRSCVLVDLEYEIPVIGSKTIKKSGQVFLQQAETVRLGQRGGAYLRVTQIEAKVEEADRGVLGTTPILLKISSATW